jgi:hypothetical protein
LLPPSGTVSRSFLLYREFIPQAVKDPFASNTALLVLVNQIELSLNECIGHGALEQVIISTVDHEIYVIKN